MLNTLARTCCHLTLMLIITGFAVVTARAQSDDTPTATMSDVIIAYEVFARLGNPEAIARAENRDPHIWPTVTQTHYAERARQAKALLQQLDALGEAAPNPEAAIIRHLLQAEIDAHRHDSARIPFTGDSGFFTTPLYAAMRTRLADAQSADAWIARLQDLPRYFDEHIANMRRGIATNWTQHSDPLMVGLAQIDKQIVTDPKKSALFMPFESLNATMPPDEVRHLQTRGLTAVTGAIDAYRKLQTFMTDEYAPAVRPEPGLSTLPGGREAYRAAIAHHTAGAGYSPEDIHIIGRSEITRIRAEMETVIASTGFDGSFAAFITFLRNDPQFYAQTPEDLLEKAADMSKRLDAILPAYFSTLPRLPYGVKAVPATIAPGYTTGRYIPGDMRKGIAGTYLVNTYRLDQRPLYELPALSAHEAVPGHHLQIALAQELETAPDFRKSYYATAFGEGWGLYAEKLAGEAGFYRTPYERFGQLSYEMWRACRLVADTGLHYYGWSRAQAKTCFVENTALSPHNIETEISRYIGWPGQATAYKIGEIKILNLRMAARSALGSAFDIRQFHDILLGAGSMPLDALEIRIMTWIKSVKPPDNETLNGEIAKSETSNESDYY